MAKWRVDPDRVMGVLAAVDEHGQQLASDQKSLNDLVDSGRSELTAGGRSAMSAAWADFLDQRHLVPGKLITVMRAACTGVSEATVDVVLGDVEMASNSRVREDAAMREWGIGSTDEYTDW